MAEKPYDSSWDEGNEEAFERIYQEWEERDWVEWLKGKLRFPFRAKREEDMSDDLLDPAELRTRNPFPIGCTLDVLGIADEGCTPEDEGVPVSVKGPKAKGAVLLQDLEVQPKSDPNFWPVREFAVWYANR